MNISDLSLSLLCTKTVASDHFTRISQISVPSSSLAIGQCLQTYGQKEVELLLVGL